MKVPQHIYDSLRTALWKQADEIEWMRLTDQDKSKQYEQWTKQQSVGGTLSRYLDPEAVRVYIKDTLMKPYVRERLGAHENILRLSGLDPNTPVVEQYIKPHGLRLRDGRVVAWGRARDWKSILFAVFERSYFRNEWRAYAAVLLWPVGRVREARYQRLISESAERFGIERLVWFDD